VSNDFIEFATNISKISSKYYPFLDRLAFQIKNNADLTIIIEGHTDAEGNQLYNYHLSQQRAYAVQNYFFQKGVPLEQVEMHFYGETKPKIDKDTELAKARNRRVELVVLKTK
jgi:outer membrane protein OmpA-like peptidoglycan-associated protein